MIPWLTDDLKREIKKVFEPRYKKPLSDGEVTKIAENLTDLMEAFLRMKWREKYGYATGIK